VLPDGRAPFLSLHLDPAPPPFPVGVTFVVGTTGGPVPFWVPAAATPCPSCGRSCGCGAQAAPVIPPSYVPTMPPWRGYDWPGVLNPQPFPMGPLYVGDVVC
jgi:hypothetical protein